MVFTKKQIICMGFFLALIGFSDRGSAVFAQGNEAQEAVIEDIIVPEEPEKNTGDDGEEKKQAQGTISIQGPVFNNPAMEDRSHNYQNPEDFDFQSYINRVESYLSFDDTRLKGQEDWLAAKAAFGIVPKLKPRGAVGGMQTTVSFYEDTLLDLARLYNLGYVELIAANKGLDPWVPGENAAVTLPSMHLLPEAEQNGIVINLGDMRLYYFDKRGDFIASFPIGIGREGLNTPLGKTKIVEKKEGPWWFPTARMRDEDPSLPKVVKAGPYNPLGSHALYMGWPTYAIHGTVEPWGIGRRVSSGCMRLYPEDIPKLYKMVPVGTKVQVVDQVYKMAWIDNKLYLEIHPSKEQASAIEDERAMPYDYPDGLLRDLARKAGEHSDKIDWRLVKKAVLQRTGYPLAIATRPVRPFENVAVMPGATGPNRLDVKQADGQVEGLEDFGADKTHERRSRYND